MFLEKPDELETPRMPGTVEVPHGSRDDVEHPPNEMASDALAGLCEMRISESSVRGVQGRRRTNEDPACVRITATLEGATYVSPLGQELAADHVGVVITDA